MGEILLFYVGFGQKTGVVVVHSDGCEGRNREYLGGGISDICQPSELIVPVPGISKYDQGVEQENIHLVCIARVQANGWQTCTRVGSVKSYAQN